MILEELILYENENTTLDFKKEEYRKENHSSFLKDIISLSNAHTSEDRFIIIGLKPKSIEDRGFFGIKGELTDSATLQQLVYENIEPEINIEYFPYQFESFQLGIIKITDCNNQPYLMKKDFGNGKNKLLRGDGFIRKGSQQNKLLRKDFDRYLSNKINEKYFNGEIKITFINNNNLNTLNLKKIDLEKITSRIKKKKIINILKDKKEKAKTLENSILSNFDFGSIQMPGVSIPYEKRSIETLEENLLNVEKTYTQHDYYDFYEKYSQKCNILIENNGNKYIEDASIIVKIPAIDGLFISPRVYSDPRNGINPNVSNLHYPDVTEDKEHFIIQYSIGDIKHQLEHKAFDVNLRVTSTSELQINNLKITCELYAKNIKTVFKETINLKILK
jgi:hypothetical protein